MEEHATPLRNIGLDLVRVTEAAAVAAGRWIGSGNRRRAYTAAMLAMHRVLNTVEIDGQIVQGEEGRLGTGVRSPLGSGASVGNGQGSPVDVVADPIDGTGLLVRGRPGAISLVGVTPRGCMWSPAPAVYMEKIVVDAEAAHALVPECMDAPAGWTLALVARVKGKAVRDLTVRVLDRPRHKDLINEIRQAGARVILMNQGDAAGALDAVMPDSNADILWGIGGAPEGVIAACAVKALNGEMLARLAPQSPEEVLAVREAGLDARRIYMIDEIVTGNEVFFAATGITNSALLQSVKYRGNVAYTHSLLLRSRTHTRRFITAEFQVEDIEGDTAWEIHTGEGLIELVEEHPDPQPEFHKQP